MTKRFIIEDGEIKDYNGKQKKVVIPDGVTSIGAWSFSSNKYIESVIIPDSVTSIKEGAFSECSNLNQITMPSSITEIGSYAFRFTKISTFAPDSVTKIGEEVYRGCRNLANSEGFVVFRNILYGYYGDSANVIIPDDITQIEGWAFYECKNIVSVSVPKGVKSIGDSAFRSCENLISLYIPDNMQEMSNKSFFGSDNVVIYAPVGCYAEQYAKENNIKFKVI